MPASLEQYRYTALVIAGGADPRMLLLPSLSLPLTLLLLLILILRLLLLVLLRKLNIKHSTSENTLLLEIIIMYYVLL